MNRWRRWRWRWTNEDEQMNRWWDYIEMEFVYLLYCKISHLCNKVHACNFQATVLLLVWSYLVSKLCATEVGRCSFHIQFRWCCLKSFLLSNLSHPIHCYRKRRSKTKIESICDQKVLFKKKYYGLPSLKPAITK